MQRRRDITQVDATDVLDGCTRSPLDEISKVKYHWVVRFGPRLSFPTGTIVRWPDLFGDDYRELEYCVGAPCHGAKLDAGTILVSGGKRVRYQGRWWRGVSPGALVRVGFEFDVQQRPVHQGASSSAPAPVLSRCGASAAQSRSSTRRAGPAARGSCPVPDRDAASDTAGGDPGAGYQRSGPCGEAKLSKGVDGVAVLSYVDDTGMPDDLRVASPAKHTITLLGPTVVAGGGCVPVPGGASCTHPDLTDLWEIVSIQVGGGDDTVTVEAPQQMVVSGDAGNDRISLGPTTVATAVGLEGDDTLIAAGSAILRGGDGTISLSAGARSALSGDAGTDRLDGSPQDDVLMTMRATAARDVIACHGGNDVTQGDETDRSRAAPPGDRRHRACQVLLEGPVRPAAQRADDAARALHALLCEMQRPFARCSGAACHDARLEYTEEAAAPADRRGGRRVRIRPLVRRRLARGEGARGPRVRFGGVILTKGFEFRTRAPQTADQAQALHRHDPRPVAGHRPRAHRALHLSLVVTARWPPRRRRRCAIAYAYRRRSRSSSGPSLRLTLGPDRRRTDPEFRGKTATIY